MKLMTPKVKEDRKRVIELREKQLADGTKPNKLGTTRQKKELPRIPLTPHDKTRIQREIQALKERI